MGFIGFLGAISEKVGAVFSHWERKICNFGKNLVTPKILVVALENIENTIVVAKQICDSFYTLENAGILQWKLTEICIF